MAEVERAEGRQGTQRTTGIRHLMAGGVTDRIKRSDIRLSVGLWLR
ncbi:MAG TPA: hypothetical protein VGD80_13245 [Kofleriaceae bacterium]